MNNRMTMLYGPEPMPGLWDWLESVTTSMRQTGRNDAYVNGYIDGVRDIARAVGEVTPGAIDRMMTAAAQELAQDLILASVPEGPQA